MCVCVCVSARVNACVSACVSTGTSGVTIDTSILFHKSCIMFYRKTNGFEKVILSHIDM